MQIEKIYYTTRCHTPSAVVAEHQKKIGTAPAINSKSRQRRRELAYRQPREEEALPHEHLQEGDPEAQESLLDVII